MRRRGFIAASASVIGVLAARLSLAKTKNSAAVVIGVDRPRGLAALRAAASGGTEVAQWLTGENFDVTLLTDSQKPVHLGDVFGAISHYIELGTFDQLLVYFAGHGFASRYDEIWLLSGAPTDPNDAIGINGTKCLAQQRGIPNVVLISDCCRSTAASLGVEQVQGSVAFPSPTTPPSVPSDVDVFYATLVGNPSWEIPVDVSHTQYKGIFTSTLLDAFKNPEASMVTVIDSTKVVTNATLKPFLGSEVPKRAQAVSITLTQRPHIEVVSGDRTFMGHVRGTIRPSAARTPEPATLALLASESLSQLHSSQPHDPSPVHLAPALSHLSSESGFGVTTERILNARGLAQPTGLRSGLVILGQSLRSISSVKEVRASATNVSGDEGTVSLELGPRQSSSVAVRFADGSGCVLAVLTDFVGKVVLDEHGVANVSYEPAPGTPFWSMYDMERGRVERLHATVATAAKFGVFAIEGGRRNRAGASRVGIRSAC